MVDINEIWESQDTGDMSVWEESYGEFTEFRVSVEGFRCYETIEEGINYLNKLNEEYYAWLKENHETDELKDEVYTCGNIIYKSYDIEIYKEPYGYEIYLEAPKFSHPYEIYMWLNGCINQIKQIKQ